jgi:hypothetical protein
MPGSVGWWSTALLEALGGAAAGEAASRKPSAAAKLRREVALGLGSFDVKPLGKKKGTLSISFCTLLLILSEFTNSYTYMYSTEQPFRQWTMF